uniref:Uncharacterized protein n=1 Tax=Glossina austeni TaxID=7395 RepID=A0A1A9UZ07_GLOAU
MLLKMGKPKISIVSQYEMQILKEKDRKGMVFRPSQSEVDEYRAEFWLRENLQECIGGKGLKILLLLICLQQQVQ